MRDEVGDLFFYPCDAIVIPINWTTKRNGEAVMGAGVALEAARRWPWLPRHLGQDIQRDPDAPSVGFFDVDGSDKTVITFPTKRHWRQRADIALIEEMARDDMMMVALQCGARTIALPRLGCGFRTGQLDWDTQVRPLLAPILDDRFVVLDPPAAEREA